MPYLASTSLTTMPIHEDGRGAVFNVYIDSHAGTVAVALVRGQKTGGVWDYRSMQIAESRQICLTSGATTDRDVDQSVDLKFHLTPFAIQFMMVNP